MLHCVSEAGLQNWGPGSRSDAKTVSRSELILFPSVRLKNEDTGAAHFLNHRAEVATLLQRLRCDCLKTSDALS